MLKIEIIKFEAQDIITASTACICDAMTHWIHSDTGVHYIDENTKCNATDHVK